MRLKSKKENPKNVQIHSLPSTISTSLFTSSFSVGLFIVEPREPPVLAETTGWLAPPPTWFSFYSRPHLNTCTPGRRACWLTCPSITQGDSLLFEYMFGSRRWTPLRSLIASSRSLSGVLQFPTMPFFFLWVCPVKVSAITRRWSPTHSSYRLLLLPNTRQTYELCKIYNKVFFYWHQKW